MRRALVICVLAVLLMGAPPASALRIGGELISTGTPVSTLTRVLGSPDHRVRVWDGDSPSHELWQYRINDLNYEFRIRGGRVERIDWSRF
jgi:hypothetical protein